jgi:cell surface hyaluronidase
LQIKDVVGYNTIGHCFFLEDGNEQDNQLIHNLGLVTKPGSLLPADRTAEMCSDLRQTLSYTPDASAECMLEPYSFIFNLSN